MWMIPFLLPVALAAQTKFVSVSGQCVREIVPDRTSLVLTAEVRDASAGTAAKQTTAIYEKLRNEIKKMNLKDLKLQTTTYTVMPETAWVKEKEVLRGYIARMGLQVETSELNRMGEIMELSAKMGVQNISDLATFVSPQILREEQMKCLDEAVKNARVKADKMAAAGSTKVGEVLRLEEFRTEPLPGPEAESFSRKSMAMASGGGPQIEARSKRMELSVYVTYSLQ